MIELGQQQAAAIPQFVQWFQRVSAGDRSVPPGFVILGLGGTGKTTLAKLLAEAAGLAQEEVAGGALQASAASRLQEISGWDCRTLHRWNYKVEARVGMPTWFVFNPASPLKAFRLLVIDEVSQINLDLWRDTIAHGVPVLVLGDPGQLLPVSGDPISPHLTADVTLTEIHRQAAGSPIIRWSMQARLGATIPYGEFRDDTSGEVTLRKVRMSELTTHDYLTANAILVGTNETRIWLNQYQRRRLGHHNALPDVGETVVCRKNQLNHGLVNAHSGEVLEASRDRGLYSYDMTVRIAESGLIVPSRTCSKRALGLPMMRPVPRFLDDAFSHFSFGYVHTVHSFIGRQADSVLLIDEHPPSPQRNRWLYTGITRGARTVTIAVPDEPEAESDPD